jgi:ABC-2 type transport system ATP-binding protein
MDLVIHTEDLTKSYGHRRGIVNVNLDVVAGEVFGFLGPNGSGKTTTIRTLLDLMRPTSGKAYLFGLDSHRDSVSIRGRVGNLPGEFNLDDRLTGEQLIGFFGRLRGVGDLSHARSLAERLDLDLASPMRQLSKGNKQKVGLVQALFHRPPLVILDEPTSGLDPLVQEEFHAVLNEVRAEGRTVFFSSHVLSEVEHLCDRVGIVREGELVATETTESLLSKRLRHMTIRFAQPVEREPFAALSGVSDVRVDGATMSLSLHDGLDQVVKLAARHTVIDMELPRPSLEEVFLTYYGGGVESGNGSAAAGGGS